METSSQLELHPMVAEMHPEGPPPSSSSSSSMGWPFGLPTCIAIQTPSPKQPHHRRALSQVPAQAFHQQFMNLQTTFLLPFFSDAGESSSSDDSEAASSFFKDSRRITLGNLISLPMDHSFHHNFDGAHFPTATGAPRRTLQLPSCGILELLGCARSGTSSLGLSDQDGEIGHSQEIGHFPEIGRETAAVRVTSGTLAAYLQLEVRETVTGMANAGCGSVLDALSNGSHSPDWNDQFVSCHSILSEVGPHVLSPRSSKSQKSTSTTSTTTLSRPSSRVGPKSQRMQRSSSMKSFFSSICCRTDAVQRPSTSRSIDRSASIGASSF